MRKEFKLLFYIVRIGKYRWSFAKVTCMKEALEVSYLLASDILYIWILDNEYLYTPLLQIITLCQYGI